MFRSKTTLQHNIALWKLRQKLEKKPNEEKLAPRATPPWANLYETQKYQEQKRNTETMNLNQELYLKPPDFKLPTDPLIGCTPKLIEVNSNNEIEIIDPNRQIALPSALKTIKQVSFAKSVDKRPYSIDKKVTFGSKSRSDTSGSNQSTMRSRDKTMRSVTSESIKNS